MMFKRGTWLALVIIKGVTPWPKVTPSTKDRVMIPLVRNALPHAGLTMDGQQFTCGKWGLALREPVLGNLGGQAKCHWVPDANQELGNKC